MLNRVLVNKQNATVVEYDKLVSGAINYQEIFFEFDETWDDLDKHYQFSKGDITIEVVNTEERTFIPYETLTTGGTLQLVVYGTKTENDIIIKRATTQPVHFNITETPLDENPDNEGEVTPTIVDQITGIATNAEILAKNAEDIAQSVRDDADEGKFDGKDGANGLDGYSPTAYVTKTGNQSNIVIIDKVGTTTATVLDGKDGVDGINGTNGANGKDGISPTAKIEKVDGEVTITITDKDGTTSENVSAGIDGFSPTANVTKENDISTITITDKNGTTTASVRDGRDGINGRDGANGRDGTNGTNGIDGKDAKINGQNTVNIVAGTNVDIDQVGDTLTINAEGGATGTTDYTELINKPKINSVELDGNKTLSDLGIQSKGDYVKTTDYATPVKAGVIKTNATYGVEASPEGILRSVSATVSNINAKTNNYKPIVSSNLDYAVKAGITTNANELTEEEKISARNWLGAGSEEDIQNALTTATEANSIAKQVNKAKGYENYQALINELNNDDGSIYNVGQSMLIVTLNVPDLWISSIEETSEAYEYIDDTTIVASLQSLGYIQVGFYKLSMLETLKQDLTNYAKFDNFASTNKTGVVKVNAQYGTGVSNSLGGMLLLQQASNSDILAKANNYKPIVSSSVDYAVKTGITTNTMELTDEEKISAQNWLGIQNSGGQSKKKCAMFEIQSNEITDQGTWVTMSTPLYNNEIEISNGNPLLKAGKFYKLDLVAALCGFSSQTAGHLVLAITKGNTANELTRITVHAPNNGAGGYRSNLYNTTMVSLETDIELKLYVQARANYLSQASGQPFKVYIEEM